MSGRTMVSADPLTEGIPALDVIYPILMSHEPVDLLIIMLGTNDTKDRFGLSPACIAAGMGRLLNKAKATPCWGTHAPNILVICPPHIGKEMVNSPIGPVMGEHCAEKSAQLAAWMEPVVKAQGFVFLDAEGIAQLNQIDYTHLTCKGHAQLAECLAQIVPGLV